MENQRDMKIEREMENEMDTTGAIMLVLTILHDLSMHNTIRPKSKVLRVMRCRMLSISLKKIFVNLCWVRGLGFL